MTSRTELELLEPTTQIQSKDKYILHSLPTKSMKSPNLIYPNPQNLQTQLIQKPKSPNSN